jgi:hypothetical protein
MRFLIPPTSSHEMLGKASDAYFHYLNDEWHRLPKGVKEFVKQPWYYIFTDHRCPHDADLKSLGLFGGQLEVCYVNSKHASQCLYSYKNVNEFSVSSEQNEFFSHWYGEIIINEEGDVLHEVRSVNNHLMFVRCRDIEYKVKTSV